MAFPKWGPSVSKLKNIKKAFLDIFVCETNSGQVNGVIFKTLLNY